MLVLTVVAGLTCAMSLIGGLVVRFRLVPRPAEAAVAATITAPQRWRSVAASLLRPYWPVEGLAVWLMILDTALSLAAPWPLQFVVDYGLGHRTFPAWLAGLGTTPPLRLAGIAAAAGLLFLGASAIAGYLVTFLTGVLSERMTLRLRAGVLEHVLRATPAAVSQYPLGELTSRIGPDVRQVSETISAVTETLIPDLGLLAGMTVITALVDWRLTLVVLGVLPLYALTARFRNRSLRGAQKQARARSGELSALATDQLARLRAVHVFDQADAEVERHATAAARSARAAVAALDAGARFRPVTEMLPGLGLAAVLICGTVEVTSHRLTIGGLLVFLAYLSSLTSPVQSLAKLSSRIATGEASRDRIAELLSISLLGPGTPWTATHRGRHRSPGVTVCFNQVSFSHGPGRPVLDGFTAEIGRGEFACLTGPSGVGKSTLMALLVRLVDPQSGQILIDYQDISHMPLRRLREYVTLVPQDPWLHTGTVADNIRYGSPTATDAQIAEVAERAGVSTFARLLPDGYQTPIGEHGLLLSGGQRRRIAIARALLRDTPLLLLDEPTAGLDQAAESDLLSQLLPAIRSKTVIVVTHNQALAGLADRVIDLEHSSLAEPAFAAAV